jgi:hypothetical protein
MVERIKISQSTINFYKIINSLAEETYICLNESKFLSSNRPNRLNTGKIGTATDEFMHISNDGLDIWCICAALCYITS